MVEKGEALRGGITKSEDNPTNWWDLMKPDAQERPILRAGTTYDAPRPLTVEEQRKQRQDGGMTVKPENPNQTPSPYPGPRPDQDRRVLEPIMRAAGPVPEMLYQSFLQNYNDRSGENKLPGAIKINELHRGIAEKVASVQILGDSDAMRPNSMLGNRTFYPDAGKHPGSAYVILYDNAKRPLDVLEYRVGSGQPQYLQQWIFNRTTNPDTHAQTVDIERFYASGSTQQGRPAWQNGTAVDTYMGTTRYTIQDGRMTGASLYNQLGPQVTYDPATRYTQARDSNSGKLVQAGEAQVPAKLYFSQYFLGF